MYNPLENLGTTVFIDSNGVTATKSSSEIISLIMRDINVILRVKENGDVIFATPTMYDSENNVFWFNFTNYSNQLTQLIGVDENGEIVYYTGG